MTTSETLLSIKATVNSFLPSSQVLLFGSRVKGNAHPQSDYDLLVITADTFNAREKMAWENKIRKALVSALDMPFDVIIQSETEANENKKLTGHIVYYAMKEAVEL